jgi:HPt (histidine-containing phosphotransfer) domain-containing protein
MTDQSTDDLTPRLQGLWLPLITPFRDGELDEASLRRLVRHYAAGPVDGFILAATSGEGMSLRADELEQALIRCGLTAAGNSRPPTRILVAEDALRQEQLERLRQLPGRKHPTLLEDIAEIFLKETPETLAGLRDLADRRQKQDTLKLAHRLAGSIASLGGEKMRIAASAVEQSVEREAWPEVPEMLSRLDEEWERVRSALQKIHSPPP